MTDPASTPTPAPDATPGGQTAPTRCGFAALVGAPNAGKSTLINQLVGAKVSIVTHKAQTTRSRIRGIAMAGAAQIILVDTPGIFRPKRRLDRAMVRAAWAGAGDADVIVLVADAARGRIDDDVRRIIDGLKANGQRAVLALNKVDGMKRERLLPIAGEYAEQFDFDAVFMISALTGSGCDDLRRHLAEAMPEGPWHYPEDELSDLPMRLMAAEVTREQVFLKLHDELPYEATVETDMWTERDDGSVRIDQTVYVERDTQRMIVLGKGGRQIKELGQLAREQLEAMLERRVHLFLFVKVREDWQEDRERYAPWGLEWDS